MSQHDYVVENQTFPSTRTDLNNLFAAILSLNSGLTAPTTTIAGMLWYDTTNALIKQRNAADSGWVTLFAIGKQGLIPQDCSSIYAADSGSADTYVGTYTPAVTSLTNGQLFLLKAANANTGPSTFNPNGTGAKAITKRGNQGLQPGDILANQLLILQYDGTNFQLVGQFGTPRTVLSSALTMYVRTDGNDANTGLANTSGGAYLTIQRAIDVLAATIDTGGYNVTIQVGDGTYTTPVVLKPVVGGGTLTIQGNNGTPANVLISTTSSAGISNSATLGGTNWVVKDLKVQTTTSGNGVTAQYPGTLITLNNVHFGACASGHVSATQHGQVTMAANYTIAGGAVSHWNASRYGVIYAIGVTITLTGTPAFSSAFAIASVLSGISAGAVTFSGSATGTRYSVLSNGVIDTNGGGATYLPGNAGGSTATGGQYV